MPDKIEVLVQIFRAFIAAAGIMLRIALQVNASFGRYVFIKNTLTDGIKRSKASVSISRNLLEAIEFKKLAGIYCESFKIRQALERLHKRLSYKMNWKQIAYAYWFLVFDKKSGKLIGIKNPGFLDIVSALTGFLILFVYILIIAANLILMLATGSYIYGAGIVLTALVIYFISDFAAGLTAPIPVACRIKKEIFG